MVREYGPKSAGQLLAWSDFVYSVVFLVFVVYWRVRVTNVIASIDADVTSMSDYSVRPFFAGLPCSTNSLLMSAVCARR